MASQNEMIEKTGNGFRISNTKGDHLDLTQDEARRLATEAKTKIESSQQSGGTGRSST